MIVYPNCKINVGLRIVERRPDGYHNLETIFYPIPLYDNLEFKELPPADAPTGDALPDSMQHAAELAAASSFHNKVLPAQTLHAYLTAAV